MAAKKGKTSNVRREALGILMQGAWVLLLLAMASYDAKDTADWASEAPATLNYRCRYACISRRGLRLSRAAEVFRRALLADRPAPAGGNR